MIYFSLTLSFRKWKVQNLGCSCGDKWKIMIRKLFLFLRFGIMPWNYSRFDRLLSWSSQLLMKTYANVCRIICWITVIRIVFWNIYRKIQSIKSNWKKFCIWNLTRKKWFFTQKQKSLPWMGKSAVSLRETVVNSFAYQEAFM